MKRKMILLVVFTFVLALLLTACFDMSGRMPAYEVSFETGEEFKNYLSDFDTVFDTSERAFIVINPQNNIAVIKYSYIMFATDSFEFFHQFHKQKPTRDYQVSSSNVTIYLNVCGYDAECFYFVEEIGRIEKSELVLGSAEVAENDSGFIYTINISYQNDDVICLTVKSDGKITQETLDSICELIVESLEIVKI